MHIHESGKCQEGERQRTFERSESSAHPLSAESTLSSRDRAGETLLYQRIAEHAHNETKAGVLESYKSNISASRREVLEDSSTSERVKGLSTNEYHKQFPESNPLVLGCCDSEGNIYIKAVSENAVAHISTHEAMHLCSNRESGINERGNWSIRSGLRESEFDVGRTMVSDSGRGINEGATEMYTLRELNRRGEQEAARAFDSYPQSREWAERLEQMVGPERLADAYFNGTKETLSQEFNRLDEGRQDAWESFSRNVDIVEYSGDAKAVQCAQRELAEQYFRMILEKDLMGEMNDEHRE